MSFTAFLVDDDLGVLKAWRESSERPATTASAIRPARDFLREHDPSIPGCRDRPI